MVNAMDPYDLTEAWFQDVKARLLKRATSEGNHSKLAYQAPMADVMADDSWLYKFTYAWLHWAATEELKMPLPYKGPVFTKSSIAQSLHQFVLCRQTGADQWGFKALRELAEKTPRVPAGAIVWRGTKNTHKTMRTGTWQTVGTSYWPTCAQYYQAGEVNEISVTEPVMAVPIFLWDTQECELLLMSVAAADMPGPGRYPETTTLHSGVKALGPDGDSRILLDGLSAGSPLPLNELFTTLGGIWQSVDGRDGEITLHRRVPWNWPYEPDPELSLGMTTEFSHSHPTCVLPDHWAPETLAEFAQPILLSQSQTDSWTVVLAPAYQAPFRLGPHDKRAWIDATPRATFWEWLSTARDHFKTVTFATNPRALAAAGISPDRSDPVIAIKTAVARAVAQDYPDAQKHPPTIKVADSKSDITIRYGRSRPIFLGQGRVVYVNAAELRAPTPATIFPPDVVVTALRSGDYDVVVTNNTGQSARATLNLAQRRFTSMPYQTPSEQFWDLAVNWKWTQASAALAMNWTRAEACLMEEL